MKKCKEKILQEICRECNLKERIIVRLFKKVIIKVYHISRINNLNKFLN